MLFFNAIVQGMTGGTIWSAAIPVVEEMVGVKDLANALSIFWLSLMVPSLMGQPITIALGLFHEPLRKSRNGCLSYLDWVLWWIRRFMCFTKELEGLPEDSKRGGCLTVHLKH